jgi:hypothetical protein
MLKTTPTQANPFGIPENKDGYATMMIQFTKKIEWLSMSPYDALVQAEAWRHMVKDLFGECTYNAAGLPFKVIANRKTGLVVTTFGQSVRTLVMNPEAFLGWADHLEARAREFMSVN